MCVVFFKHKFIPGHPRYPLKAVCPLGIAILAVFFAVIVSVLGILLGLGAAGLVAAAVGIFSAVVGMTSLVSDPASTLYAVRLVFELFERKLPDDLARYLGRRTQLLDHLLFVFRTGIVKVALIIGDCILRRLQKDGALTVYDEPFNGRNRRYYRLTDIGRERLARYVSEWETFQEGVDAEKNHRQSATVRSQRVA